MTTCTWFSALPNPGAYVERENSELFQVPGSLHRKNAKYDDSHLAPPDTRAYTGGEFRNFYKIQSPMRPL